MKRCPRCGRTANDNLGFCQYDATPLVSVSEPPPPPAPGQPSAAPSHAAPPSGPPHTAPSYAAPPSAKVAPPWIAVGVLAVVAIGALGGYFLYQQNHRDAASAPTSAAVEAPQQAAPPAPAPAAPAEATAPAAPPPAVDDGTLSLDRWMRVVDPGQGYLNLRSDPHRASAILAAMYPGSAVYVRYCQSRVEVGASGRPGRWCFLDYNGVSGWAFDAFLAG